MFALNGARACIWISLSGKNIELVHTNIEMLDYDNVAC